MSDCDDEIAVALELSREEPQPVRTYYGGEDAQNRAKMAEILVNELEARAIRLTATQSLGFCSPTTCRTSQNVKTKTSYQKKRYELLPESPATKPNKKAKISNTELDDDIAILLARGLTLRQVYEQLGLHESNMYLPDDNDARHDATISCDSSCTGTTTITSQSSFSTLTMSLDSADFYPSKPNTAVEYYGNPLRRGELRHGNPRRRRSHHHYHARDEVSLLSAEEVDPVQELKEKIRRMQQVLGRPDRPGGPTKLVADTDSDREEDDDDECESALRPLLDRGYSLPLARKILCMQQQREKEGQTHFQTTTASPSPSCRAHASQHHHPVLQIDPRDLQRLLDMGFHPKVAAQALVRSQYDLPQAADWLTEQNRGAE